mmetsp:Transcript_32077/g.73745  ORF Transcript_32077/g.73745 Transcript_32077/m.73745 type:complete len:90 (+) Transcript_32077:850-1119(+)
MEHQKTMDPFANVQEPNHLQKKSSVCVSGNNNNKNHTPHDPNHVPNRSNQGGFHWGPGSMVYRNETNPTMTIQDHEFCDVVRRENPLVR